MSSQSNTRSQPDRSVPFRLPIIDLSTPDRVRMARDVVDAARKYGFLYVKNWRPVLALAAGVRAEAEKAAPGGATKCDGPVVVDPAGVVEQSGHGSGGSGNATSTGQAIKDTLSSLLKHDHGRERDETDATDPLSRRQIERLFGLSAEFFAQPVEEKEPLRINSVESGKNRGWTGFGGEDLKPTKKKGEAGGGVRTGDPKEAFNIGEFRDLSRRVIADEPVVDRPSVQPLGPVLGPNRPTIREFYQHCQDLCLFLLRLFAIGLEIDGTGPESRSGSVGGEVTTTATAKAEKVVGGGDDDVPVVDEITDEGVATVAIGIPEPKGADWFAFWHDPTHGPTGSVLRLLYYPGSGLDPSAGSSRTDVTEPGQKERVEKTIRAGAHSDYGSITLLFQQPGQPGLEVLIPDSAIDHDDDAGDTGVQQQRRHHELESDTDHPGHSWLPVAVNPENTEGNDDDDGVPPILVNVGDLLSFWTGGYLKSTIHRVVMSSSSSTATPSTDRYSIAFFCHPLDTTPLTPVPSPFVAQARAETGEGPNPVQGHDQVLTAAQHLQKRLGETYI